MLDWFWKLPDGVQHSLFAACFVAGFAPLEWWAGTPLPALHGALYGIAFYYGREIADADSVNRELLTSIKVLWPGNWHRDSLVDFLWPLVTNTMLGIIIDGGAWLVTNVPIF